MIFVILAGYCRVWEFFSYMICPDCASMMMADVYKILAEVSDLGIDQMIGGDK